jgi:diapolycopene oxygenase
MAQDHKSVIVVGGGLGGIAAAVSLASAGCRVTLFEKNERLGGKLNLLERDGFSFDLGPSIIILPHLFRRLFEGAGRTMEDYVSFQELPLQWRSFFEDGAVLDLHSDARQMERELEKLGADAAGYWAFLEYSRTLYRFAEAAYLERGADGVGEIMRGFDFGELYAGVDPLRTMDQGVARFVKHPHLRDMLCFFIKYVGSSAFDAPALMNLLAYSQLGWGLWYVRGGMYNLARGLGRLLQDLGVRVELGAEVVEITRAGSRVAGVALRDGTRHAADVVVCNMEVIPAYERLLGERDSFMLRRYRFMFAPAASGLVLHLGVRGDYPQLAHHNFFFSRDLRRFLDTIHRRKELPEDPTIYLVCPTRTDPALAPAGHSIIKILPHVPPIQPRPFRREDYLALKERVLDKLERMGLRDLRSRTVVEDMLTPDDLERMYYSNGGAIYGVAADRRRNFGFKAPKRSERYDNLYFVGGSVNPGGGTPMVVTSGMNAARQILEAER